MAGSAQFNMRSKTINTAGAILGCLLLSPSVLAKDDFPDVTAEGLLRIHGSELSLVYAAEGVDLGVYHKVWLVDASVSFKKNWQREQNQTYANKVRASDMERIKSDLASLFTEVFTEKLTEAGHELVTGSADDVLVVKPAIVNLVVNAPDTRSVGQSYQFVESAGEMSLYMELFDSVTGDILVKALDRQIDPRGSQFQWQTKTSNRIAAKKALSTWAERLANALGTAQRLTSGAKESE